MFVEEKKEDVTFRETGTAYETKDDSLVAEYEAELPGGKRYGRSQEKYAEQTGDGSNW